MSDMLFRYMETYFLDLQSPANEDAGWRRYTVEAMAMDYGTRLTGEPIEHDMKMINEAMRIRSDDPELKMIKNALHNLPPEQYNAICAKYWYVGGYFDPDPKAQPWGKIKTYDDTWRSRKVGQSIEQFRKNVFRARCAVRAFVEDWIRERAA